MISLWDIVHHLRAPALEAAAALAPCRREAAAFAAVLEGMPIGIRADDVLAGEFGVLWAPPALAQASAAPPSAARPSGPADARALMRDRFHIFGGYTTAHTTLDYARVVTAGLGAVSAQAQERRRRAVGEARDTLDAMVTAVEAVCAWGERYAQCAEAQAATAAGDERLRLERLASACRRVPRLPARDFHEALQAVWLVHAAIGLAELSQASLSLGCLDQYLYPLFEAAADRRLVDDSLRDLFGKLNRYGDAACAVNLGGVDAAGRDQFNALSERIVELVEAAGQPAPLLVARVHDGIPAAVLDRLCTPTLARLGQPSYYGEESCRDTLVRRGVAPADLERWCANSCMGLYVPGAEISDMWGGVVNLLLPLELALNGGRPLNGDLPIPLPTPAPTGIHSLTDLQAALLHPLRALVGYVVQCNREATRWQARERPNPFLSAVTEDCIERGLDRAGGGARYHGVIIEGFGLVNAADALTALDQVVFRSGRYALADVVTALASNFAGAEDLRQALLAAPKFGRADATADAMVRWLADAFADAVISHNGGGPTYLPSFHTLNAHLGAGAKTAASADGRRAGEPLAKNLGPMLGGVRFDHTEVLLSCSSVPQNRFSGGQAVDLSIAADELGSAAGRAAFQALLRTYFRRGGLQVQINGVTPALLRAAMANPDQHREVTVRIAGYSARFVTLPRAVQEEMLQRFDRGL